MSNFSEKSQSSNSQQLSENEQKFIQWLKQKKQCTLPEVVDEILLETAQAQDLLEELTIRGLIKEIKLEGGNIYVLKQESRKKQKFLEQFLTNVEKKIGRIKFSTLIFLTFVTAFLLIPFVFSPVYLPILRSTNFDLHQFLKTDTYKLTTGFIALFFVLLEMILTMRKRGRGWLIKISIPGSLILWRTLHIFAGVGLLAIILVHTAGANGLNFNAIFLWIFFGVTLSALVGSVAEMGVLESAQRVFGSGASQNNFLTQFFPRMSKGQLIRSLRDIWLSTHIFLVNVFFVMLIFHILISFYYQ